MRPLSSTPSIFGRQQKYIVSGVIMIRVFMIFFMFLTVVPVMGATMEKQFEDALEKFDTDFIEKNSADKEFVEKYIKNESLIQEFLQTHYVRIQEGKRDKFEKIFVCLINNQADFNPEVFGESLLHHTINWDMKNATSAIFQHKNFNKDSISTSLAEYVINSEEMFNYLLGRGFGSIHDLDGDGNTLLHTAVGKTTQFNKKYIEFLISKIDINSKNKSGQTPIIYVISNNIKQPIVIRDYVDFLINKGSDLKASDVYGNTALIEALRTPRIPSETIELLINKTENHNITNIGGMTPLHLSVVHYPEFIEALCAKDPTLLDHRNSENHLKGDTPLITAVKWINFASVKKLIELGADINKPDSFGGTPLYHAKKADFAEIIALLEYRGAKDADPKVVEDNLKQHIETRPLRNIDDAIDLGKCTEDAEFIKNELKKKNYKIDSLNTYFRNAGAKGNVPCVELFLDLGADLNHKDEEDFDILMDALYYGNLDLVKYLHRERKMDLHKTTDPPLLTLASTASSAVFDYMVKNGAKVDDPKKYFDRALNFGGAEVCQYLVDKYNVKYNPKDSQEYLGNYIENGKPEFIKFYINNRGDINASVKSLMGSNSLLTYALMHGEKNLALFLIENGIDTKNEDQFNEKSFEHLINLGDMGLIEAFYGRAGAKDELETRDRMGKTPLLMALDLKRSEIARLLISLGADVNVKDSFGTTPLHLSVENGYLQTTKLLLEKGAVVNAVDHMNNKPCDLATKYGYGTLEKILK
jgi:ankyrin repeat protein